MLWECHGHIEVLIMRISSGLIQNADRNLVHIVEELVLSYISGSSLILLTIPMSGRYNGNPHSGCTHVVLLDDMENQAAVRLAKDVDPHGARTIGTSRIPILS